MSNNNRTFGAIMQTFRHKNFCVFFTVPDMSMIDKQVRLLTHCVARTIGIDFSAEKCILQPYFLENDFLTGFQKWRQFRIKTADARYRLNMIRVFKPDSVMIRAYKARKEEFTKLLNLKSQDKLTDDIDIDEGKYGVVKVGVNSIRR